MSFSRLSRLTAAHACLLSLLAGAQIGLSGPLTPPGPPAPSMKTLVDIEPRIAISQVPFTITNSGSYYLTTNLSLTGGAIVVFSTNVTIDLNGFSLVGGANSPYAILALTAHNLTVRNGTVSGIGGTGGNAVDASAALNCVIEGVRFVNNAGGAAASLGYSGTVKNCVFANNKIGILAGSDSVLINNQCISNFVGIEVLGPGGRVEGNHVAYSGADGIQVTGTGVRVEGNHVSYTAAGPGILVFPGSTNNIVVKNSSANNAGGDFSISPGNIYGQVINPSTGGGAAISPWANFSGACAAGLTSCSGACVNLAIDLNNCSACGSVCSLANATAACAGSACVIASCNPGFGDCNHNPGDGCETNTNTNNNNCGVCGNVCPNTKSCVNGTCQ